MNTVYDRFAKWISVSIKFMGCSSNLTWMYGMLCEITYKISYSVCMIELGIFMNMKIPKWPYINTDICISKFYERKTMEEQLQFSFNY